MLLSAKIIKNFCNINDFSYGNQWTIRAGEPNTLYFQLVDKDKDGLRYIAGVGSNNQPVGVIVTFASIDSAQTITATATQVSSADGSVWAVSLSGSQVPKSGSVTFAVTEGSVTRRFTAMNVLGVEHPGNDGSC